MSCVYRDSKTRNNCDVKSNEWTAGGMNCFRSRYICFIRKIVTSGINLCH